MPRWRIVSWIVMGKRQLENEEPLAEADEAAGQSTQKQRLTSCAPSASDASPAELADRLSLGKEMQRCHSLGGTFTEPPELVYSQKPCRARQVAKGVASCCGAEAWHCH